MVILSLFLSSTHTFTERGGRKGERERESISFQIIYYTQENHRRHTQVLTSLGRFSGYDHKHNPQWNDKCQAYQVGAFGGCNSTKAYLVSQAYIILVFRTAWTIQALCSQLPLKISLIQGSFKICEQKTAHSQRSVSCVPWIAVCWRAK